MLDSAADYLHGRARYAEARSLCERALAICETRLGPTVRATAVEESLRTYHPADSLKALLLPVLIGTLRRRKHTEQVLQPVGRREAAVHLAGAGVSAEAPYS